MADKNNVPSVFTPAENEIWNTIATSPKTAAQLIPDTLTPAEVWDYLKVVTTGLQTAQRAVAKLKPFLGRILVLVRQHEHLYKQLGYESFNDFMGKGVPLQFNISRAEAFNCLRIAEVLPNVPSGQLESLGFSKLNVIASAVRNTTQEGMSVEMVQQKTDYWVSRAETQTAKDLREEVEDQIQANRGELGPKASVVIYVSPETKKRWREFVADANIQSYCNSEDPGSIFERLLDECSLEWSATVTDALRGQ
jgi:hypothetical protein